MLLQGNQSIRQQRSTAPAREERPSPEQQPEQIKVRVTPQPGVPSGPRNYPPINWKGPSLGKSFADGAVGISKSMALLLLFSGVFVGAAMVIAIVVANIVWGLGFDLTASY